MSAHPTLETIAAVAGCIALWCAAVVTGADRACPACLARLASAGAVTGTVGAMILWAARTMHGLRSLIEEHQERLDEQDRAWKAWREAAERAGGRAPLRSVGDGDGC